MIGRDFLDRIAHGLEIVLARFRGERRQVRAGLLLIRRRGARQQRLPRRMPVPQAALSFSIVPYLAFRSSTNTFLPACSAGDASVIFARSISLAPHSISLPTK